MNTIQQPTSRRKRLLVTLLIITVCCLWSLLALYAIIGGRQDSSVYAPQVVYTAPVAPAPGRGPSFYTGSHRSGTLMYRHAAPAATYTPAPKPAMGSTSMRVHQTSNATVHSYGGGGTGSGSAPVINNTVKNGGVSYAAYAYSGAIYIPTAHNAVTAVGASEAEDVSAQKLGAPRRAKMDGGFPSVNPDPDPNEEPPVPMGDTPWLLMALLVAGYILCSRKNTIIRQIIANKFAFVKKKL